MKQEFTYNFSNTGGIGNTGYLFIEVPSLNNIPIPVEIRDETLRLLGRSMTESQIALNEGVYGVRVLFPDGQVHFSMVNVTEGEDPFHHIIDWRPKSLFVSPIKSTKFHSPIISKRSFQGNVYELFTRLVGFRNGTWVIIPELLPGRIMNCTTTGKSVITEILVQGQNDEVCFLEICNLNGILNSIALPLAPSTEANICKVLVIDAGDTLNVTSSLAGSKETELVAEFMKSGAMQEATEIMKEAEDLLYWKLKNPIQAALGGYALLRLGDLQRLHHWPMNLANKINWLPDGAVIAGELAARTGEHEVALDYFTNALNRGLPIFCDGFSILLSRLRYYSLYGGNAIMLTDNVSKGLEHLLKWSHVVDYSAQTLTLNNLSLIEESIPPLNVSQLGRSWHHIQPLCNDKIFL